MEFNRKHYLYSTWYWLNTQQKRHQVDPAWSDLKIFIQDLGDRPSEQHRLHKIDSNLGYIRGNVVWRKMLKHDPEQQAWHIRNPDKVKNNKLRHKFGITIQDYNNMLEAQNGACAICGSIGNGKKALAVDHCHTTGKIRGLLCDDCNNGLGRFRDNKQSLLKAIDYLD